VNTAKDNVFGAGARGFLREFVRVASKVGKADDFIALVVVAKDDRAPAQFASRGSNARIQAAVWEYEIIIERTSRARSMAGAIAVDIYSAFSSFLERGC